jgi:hypothetical protein
MTIGARRFAWPVPATPDRTSRRDGDRAATSHLAAPVSRVSARTGFEDVQGTIGGEWSAVLRLMLDLGASLVTLEPGAIDETIGETLRQIAETLKLDVALVWRKDAEEAGADSSHCWISQSRDPLADPSRLASCDFFRESSARPWRGRPASPRSSAPWTSSSTCAAR